jgi:hypothetical protein
VEDEPVRIHQSTRPRRPMTNERRARLGGLTVVATRGADHMTEIGRSGQSALDRRLATEAGIPVDAPDYEARLKAARSAHFIRLAERRWSRAKGGPA